MDARLVLVGGEAITANVKLKLPTVVGRGRDVSLVLRHTLVSRQHCEIFEVDGQLMVRDLNSKNGTFVGNQPIGEEAVVLADGDLLTIGAVTFRAVYENSHPSQVAGDDIPVAIPVPGPVGGPTDSTVKAPSLPLAQPVADLADDEDEFGGLEEYDDVDFDFDDPEADHDTSSSGIQMAEPVMDSDPHPPVLPPTVDQD